MSESESHRRLTRSIVAWIAEHHLQGDQGAILVDDGLTGLRGGPPLIGGFRPDVYLAAGRTNPLVVGEAETARDLERKHTADQLCAFLEHCAHYPGAVLVLGVPWYVVRCARSLLDSLKLRGPAAAVATVVLEKLEG